MTAFATFTLADDLDSPTLGDAICPYDAYSVPCTEGSEIASNYTETDRRERLELSRRQSRLAKAGWSNHPEADDPPDEYYMESDDE